MSTYLSKKIEVKGTEFKGIFLWLVVEPPAWKILVKLEIFPIIGVKKKMFETIT